MEEHGCICPGNPGQANSGEGLFKKKIHTIKLFCKGEIMAEKLLTLTDVVKIVGFKKSTIYKFIKEGKFPKQIKIGKSSRWKLSDIQKWMKEVTSA